MEGWICGKDSFVEEMPGMVFRASRQKLFFFFLFFWGIFHGCRIIVSVVIAAANAFLYGSQKESFDNAQIKETEDYQDFFCKCPVSFEELFDFFPHSAVISFDKFWWIEIVLFFSIRYKRSNVNGSSDFILYPG